jgi:hypothetical protein
LRSHENGNGGEAIQGGAAATAYGAGLVLAALTLIPVAEWLVRHVEVHRPARRWFRENLGAPTNQVIYKDLFEVRREPSNMWDQWLIDSLLADIDAYYHLGRRLNRLRLPLLLISDAAPGTLGGVLLRHLRADQAGHTVPRRSALVVVAHTGAGDRAEMVVRDEVVVAALHDRTQTFQLPDPDDMQGRPTALTPTPGPVAGAVSITVIVAVILAAMAVGPPVTGGMKCGQGISMSSDLVDKSGQCIGVTEGSSGDAFFPEMAKVAQAIKTENDAVEKKGTYATVPLMLPMSTGVDAERKQVLSEVKGAYLARWKANHDRNPGAQRPRIRLHLANPGTECGHRRVQPGVDHAGDEAEPVLAEAETVVQPEVVGAVVTVRCGEGARAV